ncbi:uncharacterized protein LOC127279900 [Leptopilina boulardi]|uniref:uncharacterized protein LOC127279900 n=1 Tax=Leptopilina boulardi TaxID=63433 RepID=UPI0021F54AF2|nr:uncharacterized protein LOC127279900 [Leptopilina boulardi]
MLQTQVHSRIRHWIQTQVHSSHRSLQPQEKQLPLASISSTAQLPLASTSSTAHLPLASTLTAFQTPFSAERTSEGEFLKHEVLFFQDEIIQIDDVSSDENTSRDTNSMELNTAFDTNSIEFNTAFDTNHSNLGSTFASSENVNFVDEAMRSSTGLIFPEPSAFSFPRVMDIPNSRGKEPIVPPHDNYKRRRSSNDNLGSVKEDVSRTADDFHSLTVNVIETTKLKQEVLRKQLRPSESDPMFQLLMYHWRRLSSQEQAEMLSPALDIMENFSTS